MLNARDIRLQSDYANLLALTRDSGGTLSLESVKGRPPEEYVLIYQCRSIKGLIGEKPIYRDQHRVRFRLPARYPLPSAPPRVDLLTPLFHPHVYPNREVCLGGWQSSEYLDQLALRIGALIQFDRRLLNVRDPANEEAMDWVRRNLRLLPTDSCTFQHDDLRPRAEMPEATEIVYDRPEPQQQPEPQRILWVDLT